MAFTSKFAYFLILLVFFCLALTQPPSDQWNCGHGCFYSEAAALVAPNRKMLQAAGMQGKEEVSESTTKVQAGSTSNGNGGGGSEESWELRRVPAGPDPLHHHGGSPKKPRITP